MEILTDSTVTLGERTIITSAFLNIGAYTFIRVWGAVEIGTIVPALAANPYLYISLPFPYDPEFERAHQLDVITLGTINSKGQHSLLRERQWLQFWQQDGFGRPLNFYCGETLEFVIQGCYARSLAYQFSDEPAAPPAPYIPDAVSLDDWISYTPTLSASTMTFGSIDIGSASYKRNGNQIFVELAIEFVPGGVAQNYVDISLPVNTRGLAENYGSGTLTRVGTSWAMGPLRSESSSTTVRLYNGATSAAGNLTLADTYTLEATFQYRSNHII